MTAVKLKQGVGIFINTSVQTIGDVELQLGNDVIAASVLMNLEKAKTLRERLDSAIGEAEAALDRKRRRKAR